MAKVINNPSQHMVLTHWGRYPGYHETLTFTDYGTDEGICIQQEIHRKFNISEQSSIDWWYEFRPEFHDEIEID